VIDAPWAARPRRRSQRQRRRARQDWGRRWRL